VHGDISPKYILGIPLGWSLGRSPDFFFRAWTGRTISSPAVLVRTRLTCRLASVTTTAGEARFQKRYILELSPQVGVLGGVPPSTPAAAPPQVGVLGGVLPSAPVATPSGGSVLLGTAASGPWLGTLLESLQRSQQLVWWKLPSTTCIPREIYPVNILTGTGPSSSY
jgi:hypothetical protein